jgi:hypothetical protein
VRAMTARAGFRSGLVLGLWELRAEALLDDFDSDRLEPRTGPVHL